MSRMTIDGLSVSKIKELRERLSNTKQKGDNKANEIKDRIVAMLTEELKTHIRGKYKSADIISNIDAKVDDNGHIFIQILPVDVEKSKPSYAPGLDKAMLLEFGVGIRGDAALQGEARKMVKINYNNDTNGYQGSGFFRKTVEAACEEFGLTATISINGGTLHYGGDK